MCCFGFRGLSFCLNAENQSQFTLFRQLFGEVKAGDIVETKCVTLLQQDFDRFRFFEGDLGKLARAAF